MEPVDSLLNALKDARDQWYEVSGILESAGYERLAPREAIANASFATLQRRLEQLTEVVFACEEPESGSPTSEILAAIAPGLQVHVVAIRDQIQAIRDQLRPFVKATLAIRDVNNNFSIEGSVGGSVVFNLDLSGNFKRLSQSLIEGLKQSATLLALCKPEGLADVTKRAEALSSANSQAERVKASLEELVAVVTSREQTATESLKSLSGILEAGDKLLQKIQAVELQATKDAAQATQQVAQVNSISANASTLQQQVAAYGSAFEAFQKQLDQRTQRFAEIEQEMVSFSKLREANELEMKRLIEKADSMIRGATTAGLSDSLETTAGDYKKRTVNARLMFNISIGFLVISAIPIALQLFWWLLPAGMIPGAIAKNATAGWESVLGRLLLLAPATWMTWFYSKSFSEFFHLEREYTHKATLAKAVEGFKREDPDHAGDIASAVFGEVLSNPASRQSPEPASHPFAEVFSKRLSEILRKAKNKP